MIQDKHKIDVEPSKSSCEICFPSTKEGLRLRDNLVSQIVNVKKQSQSELMKQVFCKTSGALQRLLRFVLNKQNNILCKHEEIWFKESTGCSLLELDNFAQHIHIYIAKRNYELDVIISQAKNMNKVILDTLKQNTISPNSHSKSEEQEVEQPFSEPQNSAIQMIKLIPVQWYYQTPMNSFMPGNGVSPHLLSNGVNYYTPVYFLPPQ